MECVHGVARLPTVGGGEPTEEVYLLPHTGRPGARYYKVCVLDFKISSGWRLGSLELLAGVRHSMLNFTQPPVQSGENYIL